jgi:hypothetical protein
MTKTLSKNLTPSVIVATATQPPPNKREIMSALISRYVEKLEADFRAFGEQLAANEKAQAEMFGKIAKSLLSDKDRIQLARIAGREILKVDLVRGSERNQKYYSLNVTFSGFDHIYDRQMSMPRRIVSEFTEHQAALIKALEALIVEEERIRREKMRIRPERHRELIADFRKQAMGHTPPSQRIEKLLTNAETVKALDAMRDAILTKSKADEPKEVLAVVS